MQKNLIKKLCSNVLCLVLVSGLLPANLIPEHAKAVSLPYNTGTRDEIATSLSNDANNYYSGSYSYSALSSLSGDSLKNKLHTLMSSTMKTSVSYKSLTSYWPYTDAEKGKANTVLFYSDEYNSSFNREHVWPKSRGSFYQTNGGCDLHHLRPTDATVNSTRGNHTMGTVAHSGNQVTFHSKTVGWLNTAEDKFEPLDNVKGDVARIYLYMYVRWQQPNLFQDVAKSQLPAFDSDDNANDGQAVIESLDTLLTWCKNDPVDTWEMCRNDLTQDIQGNRNVFIDHPELAWKLFGRTVPSNLVTPTSNNGSNTTPVPTVTPTTTPTNTPVPSPSPSNAVTNSTYYKIHSASEIADGDKCVLVGVNGKYTRAMSNTVSGGHMSGVPVSILKDSIANPDNSIIWTFKKQSNGNFALYNEAVGKYVVINSNSTSGFALASKASYAFTATNATTANAIYLSTTAAGNRKISLYQTDFRPYGTSNYKPLYIYKVS